MNTRTLNAKMPNTPPNKVIKNLTESHSWIGIIISPLLFLIFWAGAVTLFYEEVKQWAVAPQFPVSMQQPAMPLQQIVEAKLAMYPFDYQEHLMVQMPSHYDPYYKVYLDLVREEGNEDDHGEVASLLVDSQSGKTVANKEDFFLGDFLYQLHYNLNLPAGTYIVGIISLFFFFALASGIFIHAKKLYRHFFQYRTDKNRRDKLLDLHNVVGVMTLPFTLMYALSGLVFNLAIVYQIAFVIFIYQGDQDSLFKDAGFTLFDEQRIEQPLDMTPAYKIIAETRQRDDFNISNVIFYNYGDEAAIIQIRGENLSHFSQNDEFFYRVKTGELLNKTDINNYNVFRKGREIIATLHFGDFAGVDVRILYFILSIAICVMIVAGNMLWLDKRSLQQNISARSIRFVRGLSVGGCGGLVLATAVAFLCERIIPASISMRSDVMVYAFVISLVATMLLAYRVDSKRRYLGQVIFATVAVLILTLLADWLMFSEQIILLWHDGFRAVVGVEVGIFLFIIVGIWAIKTLSSNNETRVAELTAEPALD
ncbi:PepSY-associated TM helix domain-containing protein [Shewanella psychromarinicola]|uniref:PepSY domain-containing protein n=1 Tax=Shewanella psychromarinicola TaxID=2487742 RepID=A0A3N4E409_9GAMM|nr:PepSY-associated TM helix domain-containing protein [Shewanella psychromarinicola]AZG35372.1 PepSY domain-containing protein [Shewanella psychromarinicola]MCL1083596.1 PepSY domain-containing protein [Shewanella psychromarinicola]RPA32823.1 PepSY domain-containing protein [Shewanella psychromarinicola]